MTPSPAAVGLLMAAGNVSVRAGEIVAVAPGRSAVAPGTTEVVDGRGRTLLPGLVEEALEGPTSCLAPSCRPPRIP